MNDEIKIYGKTTLRLFSDEGKAAVYSKVIQNACDKVFKDSYELEIFDIKEYPQIFKDNNIIQMPTLIVQSPQGTFRLVGTLVQNKLETYLNSIHIYDKKAA